MLEIKVNNEVVRVRRGVTIIKGLEETGVRLSRYCYNERLEISGNCRMCMVEVKGAAKPVLGCVEVVREGMEIYTESALIKKAKEGVMELLLKNHPLDCPVCDQGGECDLQEGSVGFGTEKGRMLGKSRREVREKDFGGIVETEMKRCISCSRCARYMGDITGSEELGLLGRGERIEINKKDILNGKSNIVGNVIDICPVGKLWTRRERCTI